MLYPDSLKASNPSKNRGESREETDDEFPPRSSGSSLASSDPNIPSSRGNNESITPTTGSSGKSKNIDVDSKEKSSLKESHEKKNDRRRDSNITANEKTERYESERKRKDVDGKMDKSSKERGFKFLHRPPPLKIDGDTKAAGQMPAVETGKRRRGKAK